MSLWTRFRDTVVGIGKVAIGTAIGGPIGGVIAGQIGKPRAPTLPGQFPGQPREPVFPGMGVQPPGFVGAVARIGGTVLRSPAVRAGAAAAAGAVLGDVLGPGAKVPRLVRLDQFGNVIRKRRRMNPCNPKALRRAVRRLSMYHKQNKKIEAQLRKLAPPRRARRAPTHHHHGHH